MGFLDYLNEYEVKIQKTEVVVKPSRKVVKEKVEPKKIKSPSISKSKPVVRANSGLVKNKVQEHANDILEGLSDDYVGGLPSYNPDAPQPNLIAELAMSTAPDGLVEGQNLNMQDTADHASALM